MRRQKSSEINLYQCHIGPVEVLLALLYEENKTSLSVYTEKIGKLTPACYLQLS
jgi:hypothetical protein